MNINEATTEYGAPTPAGERFWLRFTGTPDEVATLVGDLARESIEFTLDPYPDDEYEVTVKADQGRRLEAIMAGQKRWLGQERRQERGELGLPFTVAGSVAQSLGRIVAERGVADDPLLIDVGGVTLEEVTEYMRSSFDEDQLWTILGPVIDQIEAEVLDARAIPCPTCGSTQTMQLNNEVTDQSITICANCGSDE